MHSEVLSFEQKLLFPLVKKFSDKFYLAGGTAVALQLGHRRSFDFDLLTSFEINAAKIRDQISKDEKIEAVLVDEANEFTVIVNQVKFTFLRYPFQIPLKVKYQGIRMPDVLTLGAMKAYTLGRRAKWKDYVDLYFIIGIFSFKKVIDAAVDIYGDEFNEKLFREQLAYFGDIDYSEEIDFMKGFKIDDNKIKKELVKFSLTK